MNHSKRLSVLRHADASWQLAGELDFQRGLTERGVAQCEAMHAALAAIEPAVELILCSGALRTRETLDHVAAALPRQARVEYDDRIYGADVDELLSILREVDPAAESVMVIGHNPTMHGLCLDLAQSGHELPELAGGFPKCALAELTLGCGWQELAADCAELAAFTRPI